MLLKEKGNLATEMIIVFSVFFALLFSDKICSKAEKCKSYTCNQKNPMQQFRLGILPRKQLYGKTSEILAEHELGLLSCGKEDKVH